MGRKEPNPGPPRFVEGYVCKCGKVFPAREPCYHLPPPPVCPQCGTLLYDMSHEAVIEIREKIKGGFLGFGAGTIFRYIRKGIQMAEKTIELGDRVKDRISGLQGIAVGITNYLYGCRRISVQPEESKDGKPADWFTVDEPQLEIMKKGAVAPRMVTEDKPRPYGPAPDISRRRDVTR